MVVRAGDNLVFRKALDSAAKLMGFDEVDSEKVIKGRVLTRVISEAD
jgi:hypothetical protein